MKDFIIVYELYRIYLWWNACIESGTSGKQEKGLTGKSILLAMLKYC